MTRLSRFLALGVALLLLTTMSAQAQERTAEVPEKVPSWVKTFGKQLKGQLESEDPMIQAQALQHITYFASFYKDKIDFSDTVPTLVDMYREEDDANVRLFALVALHTIGDKNGMRQVRTALYEQRWPPQLQFVTLAALVDFYGVETFNMDREAGLMAERLLQQYKPKARIDVGPMEMVGFEDIEEGSEEPQ